MVPTNDFTAFTPDSMFYLTEVHFVVGVDHFRLVKEYFEDNSEHFKAMFNQDSGQPSSPVVTSPGGSVTIHPIYYLTDATADEFRQFLRVFCSRQFGSDHLEKLKLSEWLTVLKLADQWKIGGVRKLAINYLNPMIEKKVKNSAELLVMGNRYKVAHWRLSALRILAEKDFRAEDDKYKQTLRSTVGEDFVYDLIAFQSHVAGVASERKGKLSNNEIDVFIKKFFSDV